MFVIKEKKKRDNCVTQRYYYELRSVYTSQKKEKETVTGNNNDALLRNGII